MKTYLIIFFFIPFICFSQTDDKKLLNPNPQKTWFKMSGFELIFSGGKFNDAGKIHSNNMRFTAVLNVQDQFHYDFNSYIGFFTGYGVRNVGFIHEIAVPVLGNVTLKQRSYSFGIPLAIKLGNMERVNYIALGVEEEMMFHYKKKVLFNDKKTKFSEWFSNDVNRFNTSVFVDIRRHSGNYIRFKYYLFDFLNTNTTAMTVPGTSTQLNFTPLQSSLFYISIGLAIKEKKKYKAKATEV